MEINVNVHCFSFGGDYYISEWICYTAIVLAIIVFYSVIGAAIGAVLERRGWDGRGVCPPWEFAACIWPITLVCVLIACVGYVLWNTVFIPSRLIYRMIAKK